MNESNFKHLIELSPDHIVVLDKSLKICYINHPSPGLTIEDLLGHSILNFLDKNDKNRVKKILNNVLKTGQPENYETQYFSTNKKIIYYESKAIKIVENGENKILLVARDITNLKKTEDKLKESENKYKSFVTEINDGIYETDTRGFFKFVNNSLVQMFKYNSAEELIGKNFIELAQDYEHERIIKLYKDAMVNNTSSEILTVAGKRKDNSLCYIEIKPVSIYKNSQVIGNKGVVRDITEKTLIEIELKENEKMYRDLFIQNIYGIIVLDLDGNIYDTNIYATKALGYQKEDLLKLKILDIHPEQDKIKAKSKLKKISKENIINFEIEFLRKDKSTFPAEISASLIELKNGLVIQGTFKDISERKEAQKIIIEQKNSLEKTNKELQLTSEKLYNTNNNLEKAQQDLITKNKTLEEKEKRLLVSTKILHILNKPFLEKELIKEILTLLKDFTGFDALGIRLKKGADYPYYEKTGFTKQFIESENKLCTFDKNGTIQCNTEGCPIHECICGNIINNKIQHNFKYYTDNGSFWTNNTTELAQSIESINHLTNYRNRCNSEGYESVAIIPLKTNTEIIGLLQLNDKRSNMFTADLITFFENIAESIGIGLARENAEEELKNNLREKDVLLKEIHHRVKNNMQLISSLLGLQMNKINDDKFKDLFLNSQNRIKSMAMIHEKLYQSDRLSKINFSDYIKSFIEYLIQAFDFKTSNIKIIQNVEDINVTIDFAIPCAQLINEIISNSMKHAFNTDDINTNKEISVIFKTDDDNYYLNISDNGKGIPNNINLTDPKTLGLLLVNAFVEQLKGNIEADIKNGTLFKITFNKKFFKLT